jgi:hypothetical protein
MTDQEFQHNMAGSVSMRTYSDIPDLFFWEGYELGQQRHYFGATFGTEEEHLLRMTPVNERGDEQRRFLAIGYQAGAAGMPISAAIRQLQVTMAKRLAAAAAGSVRSEAKAAAARENARRPRPNALGKPKARMAKEPSLKIGEHLGVGTSVYLGDFHGWGALLIDTETWVLYSKNSYSNLSELTATIRPVLPKSASGWYRWAKKVLDGLVCTGVFKEKTVLETESPTPDHM